MADIQVGLGEDYVAVGTNGFWTDGGRESEMYTASGWLTARALAQGFVEQAEGVTLSSDFGVFHVKSASGFWESYISLNLARKVFVQQVKARLKEELAAEAAKV